MKPLIAIALVCALPLPLRADPAWTTRSLHQEGQLWSEGTSVFAGTQVGSQRAQGQQAQATRWSGSADSGQGIHPGEAYSFSYLYGTTASQHVGYAYGGAFARHRAMLWNQDGSTVELHPDGASYSFAYGIGGAQQVGSVTVLPTGDPADTRAALWNGSSGWIDLDPLGTGSEARATDGATQVGFVRSGGDTFAALWRGSAGSHVDLSSSVPSAALAIGGSQVGGFQSDPNVVSIAGYWDLDHLDQGFQPLESNVFSEVRGLAGGYQVGFVDTVGAPLAVLWNGAQQPRVNLHALLPFHYTSSVANAVYVDGSSIQVIGTAYNSIDMRLEAVLWTSPVPEPATWALLGLGLAGLVRRCRPVPHRPSAP